MKRRFTYGLTTGNYIVDSYYVISIVIAACRNIITKTKNVLELIKCKGDVDHLF